MGVDIEISGLSVAYGAEDVISGLNLHIPDGCFFTLLGPSGCGKTTLLRTIAGFVAASKGKIAFGGQEVTYLPPHKRNIGMVFQDYALFPDKTVAENVAYGLRARGEKGASMQAKVKAALERVDLGDFLDRHPAALSGGQRQRVALARALVIEPQVLLMDEPLSNLDAKLRVQIRETITQLQKESNITTVFVTHDQEEALSMSDLIGVMNKGAVEQLGTPQQVYATPATGYVADFVGAANQIPVKIAQTNEENCHVELEGLTLVAANAMKMEAKQGLLILRPEDMVLTTAPQQRQSFAAKIRSRQYLGAKTRYQLEIASGHAIVAELHGAGHDGFTIGAQVYLGIDPQAARVLSS